MSARFRRIMRSKPEEKEPARRLEEVLEETLTLQKIGVTTGCF